VDRKKMTAVKELHSVSIEEFASKRIKMCDIVVGFFLSSEE
jgi:hypothetical protein